jgi:hypothetical protein
VKQPMKPECKLIGENGNVFNLIGIVRATLKDNALYNELERFDSELKELKENGGRYDDVLALFMRFVDII